MPAINGSKTNFRRRDDAAESCLNRRRFLPTRRYRSSTPGSSAFRQCSELSALCSLGMRTVVRLKEELGRELNKAGIGSLKGTGDHAEVGVVAGTAGGVGRRELCPVEEIKKLHPKLEAD